jgi:putative membrane protein
MLSVKHFVAALLIAVSASPAAAHAQEDHGGAGWTLSAWVTGPLALLLILFLVGRARLAKRSQLPRRRSWLFLAGWLVLTAALVSPLHEGGERSFTLHMIEHELIMLVATLLLAMSAAGGALAWGLPKPLRQGLGGKWKRPLMAAWQRLTEPVTATVIQALVMWIWHAPALFDRALGSLGWHITQHASFIVGSLLFWVAMLNPRRSGYGLSAACLFVTTLVGGALGALMSFSTSPWYSAYAKMELSGIGLDPTTDQQLAGLLMWIPGGLIHGAAALVFTYRWLRTSEDGDALFAN